MEAALCAGRAVPLTGRLSLLRRSCGARAALPMATTTGVGAGVGGAGCVHRHASSGAAAAAGGVDYASFLTAVSKARQPSPIRALMPLLKIDGMISLGGGLPNAKLFPFTGISLRLRDGTELDLPTEAVNEALQYSPTPGLPGLVRRMTNIIRAEHAPAGAAGENLSVSVSTGSQEALSRAFEMLVGEPGRSLLVEEPTYSGALSCLQPLPCRLVGVRTDGGGLDPADLRRLLETWDESERGAKPRVLYTIPTGSNPTGATMSTTRREEVYALACAHDLIIIEDDPYYYLQFGDRQATPSFLRLDTEGRVLRFDSFSKVLSSGLRIGTVSGPAPLVERINLHTQASNLHTSGVSQAAVEALLAHWGAGDSVEGGIGAMEAHVKEVAAFYEAQCDAFMAAVERHLPGRVEVARPTAGMFAWMKLAGVEDTDELIKTRAVEAKVLMVPGSAFLPNGGASPFVRAAFSTVTVEQMDEALSRVASLLDA